VTAGPLLDPALLARLERLQLATTRPLAGNLGGEHRSPARGSSIDFVDHREYQPGDDYRRIDYGLFARLDVLLIRLFEAEEDVHVRLLVDTSGSMGTGGKLEQAVRLAAAIGFVGLVRRDPVTVHTFPLERPAPRFTGRPAVADLFRHLEGLEATGPTPLAAAAGALLARRGPPGVTVVLSDLLTPEWEQAIDRLPARGGDVVVVHVLAPADLWPARHDGELVGDLQLADVETDARVDVSLTADALADYERHALRWADRLRARCRQVGAGYVRVLADADVADTVLGAWRGAGVLR
jgi:uncharacterized protein (DUF58 family)